MSRHIIAFFLFSAAAMPVQADTGIGLFIANERYDSAPFASSSMGSSGSAGCQLAAAMAGAGVWL